jgi:hypothetical protein
MRIYYALCLAFLLSGCATSVNITGTKPNELNGNVKSIYVIFDDFVRKNDDMWNTNPELTTSANSFMTRLGVQSESRWPTIFSNNGLQTEIARTSAQKKSPGFSIVLIDLPRSNLSHELYFHLDSVTPKYFGAFTIQYFAELRDRKQRTATPLWTGKIDVAKGIWPWSEHNLADEIAEKLLVQLENDGVIKLPPHKD